MHERQQPGDPEPKPPATPGGAAEPLWDPNEQVGDVYSVALEPGKPPPEIRKLVAEPPRVWVGSWLDYNHGVLHGEWLDADREADELHADIAAMLATSPTARASGEVAEDWGIFDCENFGPLKIGEQETVDFVTAVARGIAEHGLAFGAWADVVEDEGLLGCFAEAYLGEYESIESYAEQLVEDLGYEQALDEALPEHVRRYVEINVAGLAHDLLLSGDVHVYQREGGGVWLFDGRG